MQLELFTWESDQIAEAYGHLLSFDFEKSVAVFKEVLNNNAGNEDALRGCMMAYYWDKILEQCSAFQDKDDLEYFYLEIVGYDFSHNYLSENFKNALIKRLAVEMQRQNIFFIERDTSIADLHIELNELETAEHVLEKHLQGHPDDGRQLCRLADVQWLLGERDKAKQNYTVALLLTPGEVNVNKIACAGLKTTIEKNGVLPAPAYGYLEGLLPLLNIRSLGKKPANSRQQKAWKIYELLYQAEKARKSREKEKMIATRKHLKELEPDLYQSYFQWLDKLRAAPPLNF